MSLSVLTRTLLNGVLLGLGLLLLCYGQQRTWPAVIAVVAFTCWVNRFYLFNLFAGRQIPVRLKAAAWVMLGFVGIYLLRQLYQDTRGAALSVAPVVAMNTLLKNIGLTVILLALFWGDRSPGQRQGLMAVALGIALWGTANLSIYALGLTSSFTYEGDQFGESRFADKIRWNPAIIRSNWTLAVCSSIAAITGVMVFTQKIKSTGAKTGRFLDWLTLAAAILGVVVAFRLEFRGQLLLIPLFFGWLLVHRVRWMRIVVIAALTILMTITPFVLAEGRAEDLMRTLQIDRLLEEMGSRVDEGTYQWSRRTPVYELGIEKLGDSRLLLWGEGPTFRDAELDDIRLRGAPYHSGILDLLLSNGLVLSLTLLVTMCTAVWALARTPAERDGDHAIDLTLFYLSCWLAMSCADPGMFGYFECYVLALVPLFGSIRRISRPQESVIS